MKPINKYLIIFLSLFLFAACDFMDCNESDYYSKEQIQGSYADGILYFLQKVKAKQVYPMHFWSHCSIIDKFLAEYPEYADVIKK